MKKLRDNYNTEEVWNHQYSKPEIMAQPPPTSPHPLLKYLEPNKTLLEIGCGSAKHFGQFLDRDIQPSGIDLSSAAISQAKKRYPELFFAQHDIEQQPLCGQWDYIISCHVWEHLDNPEEVKERVRLDCPHSELWLLVPITERHEADNLHVWQFNEDSFPDAVERWIDGECLIVRWETARTKKK